MGVNQVAIGKLRVVPEIQIYKKVDPGITILGVPVSFVDRTTKKATFEANLNINEDKRVPLSTHLVFNSSDIYSPIQADFTERIYIYKYYGVNEIMTGIGGLQAFLNPIIKSILPFFTMYFMYYLAKILWYKYE